MVVATDSWKGALEKVSLGIKQQTNQAAARFKLMQKMPQNDSCFAEWYPLVKEQAERCIWLGYDGSMAARGCHPPPDPGQEATAEDPR